MPYDPLAARKAMRTCEKLERTPNGEFVVELGKILKSADEEITGYAEQIRAAKNDSRRMEQIADSARDELLEVRRGVARHYSVVVEALQAIAEGRVKSAKKHAQEVLKEITKPEDDGRSHRQSSVPPGYPTTGIVEYVDPDKVQPKEDAQ